MNTPQQGGQATLSAAVPPFKPTNSSTPITVLSLSAPTFTSQSIPRKERHYNSSFSSNLPPGYTQTMYSHLISLNYIQKLTYFEASQRFGFQINIPENLQFLVVGNV
jgi:hypothetical protein